jgi:hypothetical protein
MSEKDDLDLTELDQRRWVRFELPVLVCVDTDGAGDQHVRHVVPLLDEIEMATDDQHNPVVYDPDGTERVADHCDDDAAWQAISHAGATKDRWVGEKPYSDWDWWENPEDLTAEDHYAKEEAEEADDGDDDLESTPTR